MEFHQEQNSNMYIDGQVAMALIDSGADTVLLCQEFVAHHGIATLPAMLQVTGFGEKPSLVDRMTVPLRLQCGQMDEMVSCFVAPSSAKYQITIGRLLFAWIGIQCWNSVLSGTPS
ncbi:hypothetical protein GGF37_002313 [Kickxella alabastrina]|nr:hypothetical protein GGF37_002313 [Kickxella alabastrina]